MKIPKQYNESFYGNNQDIQKVIVLESAKIALVKTQPKTTNNPVWHILKENRFHGVFPTPWLDRGRYSNRTYTLNNHEIELIAKTIHNQ